MFKKLFTDHPKTVNETYTEHFAHAMSFSIHLFYAAIACFIHALVPGFCVKTGSKAITNLHNRMVTFRVKGSEKSTANLATNETPEYMI